MARKINAIEATEDGPVADDPERELAAFGVYRVNRHDFNYLCEVFGVSPKSRNLIGFRFDKFGVTSVMARGPGDTIVWDRNDPPKSAATS